MISERDKNCDRKNSNKTVNHWITPLYHYGEDANPQDDIGGFTGLHGQPFGTKVQLSNTDAAVVIEGASGRFSPSNTYEFYPFWVNRRILTFYAPDLLFDNEAVPTAGKLNVFGEYRMDRRHHNDKACGLFTTTLPLSGYSEYTVENMGDDYAQYDINDIFDIGDGGADEIYPGASFRKGYSANTKNWDAAGTGNSAMKEPYTKHNNLYINPRSLVLRVDGNADSSLRDGLTGVESPDKNTDYGVYYVQMYQENIGKYGGTGDSTYIDTGFSIKVDDLTDTNGIVNQNQINVFGGDTFTQATYLATRRIKA